jgi:tyrosyl-tRNA synthetase
MKNYKLKLAHWIASRELQAEQSRRNRSFRRMAVAYIVNSLIKILDDEKIWKSKRQRQVLMALFDAYAEDMLSDADTINDQLTEVFFEAGQQAERERINGIIEQFIENSDYPEVVSSLQWLQDVIKGENK